jgi:hypothetical protein
VTRIHQTLLILGAVAVVGIAGIKPSEAKPPFAAKEGKPCNYCHTQPPKRNYRGMYYQAHNLTFEGFDDAAEAKKAGVEIGPDPDPNTKPKTWTAPKEAATAETKAPEKPVAKKLTVAEAKVKAAEGLADLGEATMLDESIPPRERYPDALTLFRQALKFDPNNKKAKDSIKMIEDVYKKMGREVPK